MQDGINPPPKCSRPPPTPHCSQGYPPLLSAASSRLLWSEDIPRWLRCTSRLQTDPPMPCSIFAFLFSSIASTSPTPSAAWGRNLAHSLKRCSLVCEPPAYLCRHPAFDPLHVDCRFSRISNTWMRCPTPRVKYVFFYLFINRVPLIMGCAPPRRPNDRVKYCVAMEL